MKSKNISHSKSLDRRTVTVCIYARDLPWLQDKAYINGTTVSGFIRSLILKAKANDVNYRPIRPLVTDAERDALNEN